MGRNEYTAAYNRENYQAITIRLNRDSDASIIAAIKASGSPKNYICECIAADLKRRGISMNHGDKKAHDNPERYPYEVLEYLPNHDHYIVGYCRSLNQARDMLANYVIQHGSVGSMRILKRSVKTLGAGMVLAGYQEDLTHENPAAAKRGRN